ncbi:hypothetical protein GN958_ATG05677, partial [Phytophthora infestans]
SDVNTHVMDYFHLCIIKVKANALTVLLLEKDGTKNKKQGFAQLPAWRTEATSEEQHRLSLSIAKTSVSVCSEKVLEIGHEDKAISKNKRRPQMLESEPQMATRPPKRSRIAKEKQKLHDSQSHSLQWTPFWTSSETARPGPKHGCWTCGSQHIQADRPETPKKMRPQHAKRNLGGTVNSGDCVLAIYCANSGAETSRISSGTLGKNDERGVTCEVKTLANPIECKLPGGKKMWASGTTMLKRFVTTAADPLNLLGIDVERQLEVLALPSRNSGDDDEDASRVSGDDNDAEAIILAAKTLIQRVIDEGFPDDKVERRRTIWGELLLVMPPLPMPCWSTWDGFTRTRPAVGFVLFYQFANVAVMTFIRRWTINP